MSNKDIRLTAKEIARTEDLIRLIPSVSGRALDIGTRDGHFSRLLSKYFDSVVALDLSLPSFQHPKIRCVKGDVTNLDFEDNSFEFVFCAEVLEHIPGKMLTKACEELSRVAREYLLIGVPYDQDLRIGQTTCGVCGQINPPWGHVNSFDETKLKSLFPGFDPEQISFVGQTKEKTNGISVCLLDLVGNPYGTYVQEEVCIACNQKVIFSSPKPLGYKLLAKVAILLQKIQMNISPQEKPLWIHVLFKKKN